MIISAKLVKSRKQHNCAQCERLIPVGEKKLRLYGAAELGDRPYVIYLHPDCYHGSEQRVATVLGYVIKPVGEK